ncbi:MAG TPA: hypothetical protein VGL99_20020 [Chloroflexota bacterium]|jgi:hypothetical protein
MGFAASSRQSLRIVEQPRSLSVCRVHSCARCQSAVDSAEPCSFVPTSKIVCATCRGQEQVILHLPKSRAIWGAGLATARRA